MSVLFSELLVPGWADEKIGLDAVTSTYSDGFHIIPAMPHSKTLRLLEEVEWFAEAKSLCGGCPVRAQCFKGYVIAPRASRCVGRRTI